MNLKPEKAILLAAGYGTRIQPLSHDLPKPMMPVWGKPAIAHMVDLLQNFGVREILINLHHNPEAIIDFFRSHPHKNVQVEFSYESQILGTGGALRKASWFIKDSEFWLANTDIVADVSPEPFLAELRKNNPLSVLWLHPTLGPRTVEMTGNRIRNFKSRHPGKPGTFTFCGIHLLSPDILDYVPKTAFSSIIEAYRAAMEDGRRISGTAPDKTFWSDIGNTIQYLDAHRKILDLYRHNRARTRLFDKKQFDQISGACRRGITVNGFAAIGKNVSIERGASLHDSVIWDNAVVKYSAVLDNAIVARDTTVRGPVSNTAIRCDRIGDNTPLRTALKGLAWPPGQTTAIPLGARGSARSFTRLIHNNASAIYIHYSIEREENIHYAEIARFLRKENIPVPRVLFDDPGLCATVMEDLGNCALQEYAKKINDTDKFEDIYRRILDSLITLHSIPPSHIRKERIPLQPPFSRELYKWERTLISDHLLKKRLHLHEHSIGKIMKDLEIVAGKLAKTRLAPLHRDMQSSNIFLRKGQPFFVDFQGLRLGPVAYDVASLLCDPYVMLTEGMQHRLLNYYVSRSPKGSEVTNTFWYASVQRLAQALGAYGRLSALPGTEKFATYIHPAMQMMSRALNHLSGLPALRALTRQ